MKKKVILGSSVVILVIALFFLFSENKEPTKHLYTQSEQGSFKVHVITTGELQAKNSKNIQGPSGLRSVGVWNINIKDLIDEGTVVKKGDYIGSLDPTELANKLKDIQSELDKKQSEHKSVQLDTTLDLRTTRNDLINLKYSMEEQEIIAEQSIYEPKATQRKIKIDLDKATRSYSQALKNYAIKKNQAVAKMDAVSATLAQQQNAHDKIVEVLNACTILAPEDGMLIYKRDWDGKKKVAGSQISAWEPTVATLPDLSKMISKTYVNEIDISKIKIEQEVSITVDALPNKEFKGQIISVANIGQQRENSDAKVFEVDIELITMDSTLRPAMTTNNIILTQTIDDAIFINIEAVFAQDSLSYIFLENNGNIIRQEVITGISNEDKIIIKKGLESDKTVLLSKPIGTTQYPLKRL